MKREDIVSTIYDLLKAQRSVKLGKVSRDPIVPEELPKTGFPAAYIETSDELFEEMAAGGLRESTLSVEIVIYVSGANRDKQRNVVIQAIESTLMEDRTLGGNCRDCSLVGIETIIVGEGEPYASCRLVFEIKYCYTI